MVEARWGLDGIICRWVGGLGICGGFGGWVWIGCGSGLDAEVGGIGVG